MRTVIQPNNEKMLELVLNGCHLLTASSNDEGRELIDRMTDHVVSYRPILAAWEEEEAALGKQALPSNTYAYQNTATVRFPYPNRAPRA